MIINGKQLDIVFGETILIAAKRAGIFIPTLCSDTSFMDWNGCCRLCMVEVTQLGKSRIVSACETIAIDDMIVKTDTEEIRKARKILLQLICAEAPGAPLIETLMKYDNVELNTKILFKNNNGCILCGRCVKACELWGKGAIGKMNKGVRKIIGTPYNKATNECVGCAVCEFVCPVNAITVEDEGGKRKIWNNEFELVYCEMCGKLLTTKENYFTGHYNAAPMLCHECSEEYRKKHRKDNEMYAY